MKKYFLLLALAFTLTSCDETGGFESVSEMTTSNKDYIKNNMLPVDSMATLQDIDIQVYTDVDWGTLAVTTPERYIIATTTSNSNLFTISVASIIVIVIFIFFFGFAIGGALNS